MKHRICLNCGKDISFLQSIIHNKCCSYKCDCEYEEKAKKKEHDYWVKYHQNQMGNNFSSGSNIPMNNNNEELDDNYCFDNTSNRENLDDYDIFCLTDDNKEDDYNY